MRRIILLLFVLIPVFSFKPDAEIKQLEYDHLLWDEIKINGEIPLRTSLTELEKHFSKPLAYKKNIYYCGSFFANDDSKVISIEGIIFETLNDSVVFRSIDFRSSNIFLSTPKIKLDKNTSVKDLKSYFPNSFRNKTKGLFGGKDMLGIEVRLDEYSEHAWYVFISKNHLVKMDYWIDC